MSKNTASRENLKEENPLSSACTLESPLWMVKRVSKSLPSADPREMSTLSTGFQVTVAKGEARDATSPTLRLAS